MTTYRVGAAGATVFNARGDVVGCLPSGHVVVEGLIETPGSLAEQHRKEAVRQKMIAQYSDKRIHVDENKAL